MEPSLVAEVKRPTGRLIVFRFPQRFTLDDVGVFISDIKATLGGIVKDGQRCVACGDIRRTGILTPDVVDAIVNMLRADNPYIERTGVVVGNATFGLQVERMFREAGSPVRQAFKDTDGLMGFLTPVLSEPERAAARGWLEAG